MRVKIADGGNGSTLRYMDGMVMAFPSGSELNCCPGSSIAMLTDLLTDCLPHWNIDLFECFEHMVRQTRTTIRDKTGIVTRETKRFKRELALVMF